MAISPPASLLQPGGETVQPVFRVRALGTYRAGAPFQERLAAARRRLDCTGVVLALYTHNYGMFLLVPLLVETIRRRVRARVAAACLAIVAGAYSPWVPMLIHQVRTGSAAWVARIWQQTPPALALPKSLAAFSIGGEVPPVRAGWIGANGRMDAGRSLHIVRFHGSASYLFDRRVGGHGTTGRPVARPVTRNPVRPLVRVSDLCRRAVRSSCAANVSRAGCERVEYSASPNVVSRRRAADPYLAPSPRTAITHARRFMARSARLPLSLPKVARMMRCWPWVSRAIRSNTTSGTSEAPSRSFRFLRRWACTVGGWTSGSSMIVQLCRLMPNGLSKFSRSASNRAITFGSPTPDCLETPQPSC